MTREDAVIDPELFFAEFVILSCLAAAFAGGKQARAPGASPGVQQVG